MEGGSAGGQAPAAGTTGAPLPHADVPTFPQTLIPVTISRSGGTKAEHRRKPNNAHSPLQAANRAAGRGGHGRNPQLGWPQRFSISGLFWKAEHPIYDCRLSVSGHEEANPSAGAGEGRGGPAATGAQVREELRPPTLVLKSGSPAPYDVTLVWRQDLDEGMELK